jgi:nucleoside-diphosphate-sugar epimerase
MMTMARRRLLPVVRGDRSLLPCIHVADAVSATVRALDHGAPGGVYEIVDDTPVSMSEIVRALAAAVGAPPPIAVPAWVPRLLTPYLATVTSVRLPLSNAAARAELGWRPSSSSFRDALQSAGHRAA